MAWSLTLLVLLSLALALSRAYTTDANGCSDYLVVASRSNFSKVSSSSSETPSLVLDPSSSSFSPALKSILPSAKEEASPSALGHVCTKMEGSEAVREVGEAAASSRIPIVLDIFSPSPESAAAVKEALKLTLPVTDMNMYLPQGQTERLRARDNPRWKVLTVNHWAMLPPFVVMKGFRFVGADIDVVKLAARKLGFRPRFKMVLSFEALSQELFATAKGDFSITQPTLVLQQLRWGLDISHYVSHPQVGFVYNLPGRVDQYLTLVSPYQRTVWIMTALAIIAVILSLFLASCFGIRVSTFHKVAIAGVALINESMPDTYLKVRRAHISTFGILFIWIILSSLLSKAYKSTLLASLVAVKYEDAIDTWQDLLDNDITLTFAKGSTITDRMIHSRDETLRRVYHEQVIEHEGNLTPDWAAKAMEEGTATTLTTDYLMPGVRHTKHMSKTLIPNSYSGYLFRLKHPLRKDMDWLVCAFHEFGIYKHLRSKYEWGMARPERDYERETEGVPAGFAYSGGKLSSKPSSSSSMSLRHLYPALVMFGAIEATAAIAFLAEVASRRARRAAERWMFVFW